MEHLMACRVCLATDVKLYEMCKYRLKTAYESLTGLSMFNSECVQHVCSYCAAMINNFTTFREKCARSHQLLEMLVKEHILITTCHIKTINRHSHKLALPYAIQHIQSDSTTSENFNSTVTNQNLDSVTSDNFDFIVTNQSFDCNVTAQELSTVKVKDENNHFKSDIIDDDNYEVMKNNFKYSNNENIETYSDGEKQHDSDEEPLSKKVKKKRKKPKMKLEKNMKIKKYDTVDIKTENCPIFPLNDQNFALIDQNFSSNNQNLATDDQNLPTNDQNFPTNDQNFPNQVLDLESDHKLVILSKQEQIEEVLSRKTSANYLNSVYKCDRCFKGFMTEATYNNHMARHDPSCGPVVCGACATRWPDARALRAHTLISHERRYICKVCGHVSKSRHKAREHSRWHAGVTFPCGCGRSFSRSTSYLTHVRARHASHACTLCGQRFIGQNGLNMHTKKAHRGEKASPPAAFECARCRLPFRSSAALRRHADVSAGACDHSLHVCVQCGDHFASDLLLKEHTDVHLKTDALRSCSQCSRTFANERSLAAHAQRAHARSPARAPRACVCEVCGYTCTSASSLVNHQRVHSGEKPHACTHCHKRFSVAQRLQIHVRTHTGERPFKCARCPKAFKHKAALNRHDRVHTGVKPYSCPQCGKRFSQSNSMKQHCAGVHMKTYIYSRRNKQ